MAVEHIPSVDVGIAHGASAQITCRALNGVGIHRIHAQTRHRSAVDEDVFEHSIFERRAGEVCVANGVAIERATGESFLEVHFARNDVLKIA